MAGRRGAGIAVALGAAVLGLRALAAQAEGGPRPHAWVRPAASLVLPGAGQLLARQDRGTVYIAAELYVVSRFLQLNREGDREADRFRALAFDVARRAFANVRRDTVFEYYEIMERFRESGGFDLDPGSDFVPESDASTYNGSVWLLARRTFWADPDVPPSPTDTAYQNAIAFYRERAVGPAFLWSWNNASLEQQAFRDAIRHSDNAYRRAQNQLGLLLANHLLSAVDALVGSRLRAAVRRPASVRTTIGTAHAVMELQLSF